MATTSLALCFLFFFTLLSSSYSLELSTKGRWIVDQSTGQRVKLVCINWVSHAQTMVAEGIDKRPLRDIVTEISKRKFNCVRLTYSTHMFTRYANNIIEDNFDNLDLKIAKAGVAANNPSFLKMTVVGAFQTVIDALGEGGIMVHIDNHISQPRWCCSLDDGNGFFGDRHFNTDEWIKGLSFVAQTFTNKPQVISMSLRNEIRGATENERDWYHYVTKATRVIHRLNPKLLVVVSGLNYDNDLSFLKDKALGTNLDNKLVYETHLYAFSGDPTKKWFQNLNIICANIMQGFHDKGVFLTEGDEAFPMFVSEFGYDQRGYTESDNRFMSCFLPYLAANDLDYALWALQGSYIFREGNQQPEETYGILDATWSQTRDPQFEQRFHLIQTMTQDPSSNFSTSSIMYYSPTGQCVSLNNKNEIQLDECSYATRWSHDGDGAPLSVVGTAMCLNAIADGLPPVLSNDCKSQKGSWTAASRSKLHLAAINEAGTALCIEQEALGSSALVTRKCICIEDDYDCLDDPRAQWFKLVPTNVM